MKLEFSWQIFEKYSYIKFHEYHMAAEFSMWIDGRTDTIQTDMARLTVAHRNFVNAPSNGSWSIGRVDMDCSRITQNRDQNWAPYKK